MKTCINSNEYAITNIYYSQDDADEDDPEEEKYLNVQEAQGKLSEWIKEPRTVRFIRRSVKNFLRKFRDDKNQLAYQNAIKVQCLLQDMCENNSQSLDIVYQDLVNANRTIALWIAQEPSLIMPYLNKVAMDVVLGLYPNYGNIFPEVFVKIKDFMLEEDLRNIRHRHLGRMIKIKGVVTRR